MSRWRVAKAPEHERSRSLGWLAIAWIEELLEYGRGGVTGLPVKLTDEVCEFILDVYSYDTSGRRCYDSAMYSRPKGADKSGLSAYLAMFEACGPCRALLDADGKPCYAEAGEIYEDPYDLGFVYEYEPGELMGKHVRQPMIRIIATEAGQSGNIYDTIYYNFTKGPLSATMDNRDAAGRTRIFLPSVTGGGSILPSTAGAASKDGGLETFVSLDETHLYHTTELRDLMGTVTRNLGKRGKEGTWYLETTTMYAPGQDSIAERTFDTARAIESGKTTRSRLLMDHRYADVSPDDLNDEERIRELLREAYGDATWIDLDGILDKIMDPRNPIADSIRYYFNALTATSNGWIQPYAWSACELASVNERRAAEGLAPLLPPAKGDRITLGFDGSRSRARGIADATALVACRVDDGLVWPLAVWEQPAGQERWEAPASEIEAAVEHAFATYDVVGFYADPARWETTVAKWESKYGARLSVKSTVAHPIERWMTGGTAKLRTVKALEAFKTAIVEGELAHLGDQTLTMHVLAARMVPSKAGVQIAKEHPQSPRKIDAAVAGVLAWAARVEALAKKPAPKTFVPERIR